jgi:hypothetical protein
MLKHFGTVRFIFVACEFKLKRRKASPGADVVVCCCHQHPRIRESNPVDPVALAAADADAAASADAVLVVAVSFRATTQVASKGPTRQDFCVTVTDPVSVRLFLLLLFLLLAVVDVSARLIRTRTWFRRS